MLKMFRSRLTNRKGFTLIELLVVVAIIGILAAIAIPKFSSANESARGAKLQADLRTLDSAIQMYTAQKGSTPGDGAFTAATWNSYVAVIPTPPSGTYTTSSTANGTVQCGSYTIGSGRAICGAGSYAENI